MTDEDMLKHYSAALDEIYALRLMATFEAQVLDGALLYVTLPKRVRALLEEARTRLRATAHGRAAVGHLSAEERRFVVEMCGAPMTLTRHEWETNR